MLIRNSRSRTITSDGVAGARPCYDAIMFPIWFQTRGVQYLNRRNSPSFSKFFMQTIKRSASKKETRTADVLHTVGWESCFTCITTLGFACYGLPTFKRHWQGEGQTNNPAYRHALRGPRAPGSPTDTTHLTGFGSNGQRLSAANSLF